MKICSMCKEKKSCTSFYKDGSRIDGLQRYCKTCVNTYRRSDKYRKRRNEVSAPQWRKSEKGKIVDSRHRAKRNRNLGFTPLMSNPFPEEIPVDYHHINDTFVVPVPRQVHKSMYGKNHRIKVNDWIEEHIGLIGV